MIGVLGNLFYKDITFFNEGLYADLLRGSHATGVASVRGTHASVMKRAMTPSDLMSLKGYDSVVHTGAELIIGHNRHGTRGDNGSHLNAHPFNFPNVVGAHNGTLDHSCVKNLHNHMLYGTDSEALYSEINENGIDEALSKVSGAWALTFFDKKERTFNILRNTERPLVYAYNKERTVMYWASEPGLLYWIAERNKIEFEDGQAYHIPVDTLHTWKVDGKSVEDPETRELKSTYTTTYTSNYTPRGPYRGRWCSKTNMWISPEMEDKQKEEPPFQTGGTTSTTSTGTALTVVIDNDKEFLPPYYDGDGQIIGRPRFYKIMSANCCAYCGDDTSDWGDKLLFMKSKTNGYHDFLCEECCGNEEKVAIAKTL